MRKQDQDPKSELFRQRLDDESQLVRTWFENESFESDQWGLGLEVEGYFVDNASKVASKAPEILAQVSDPLIKPELGKFNFEINSPVQRFHPQLLSRLETGLNNQLEAVKTAAKPHGCTPLLIGILPTLTQEDLTVSNMTDSDRYRIMNKGLLALRENQPFQVDIKGDHDRLVCEHPNIMFESATTGLQINLSCPFPKMARYYNASLMAAAPLVGISANSPYLFGKQLYDETRVPLFEQCINVTDYVDQQKGVQRTTFGTGYIRHSLYDLYQQNRHLFPPLATELTDQLSGPIGHVQLHNGTIWRWSRPKIQVEPGQAPSLRIESRVSASGPTVRDMVASTAFWLGLVTFLVELEIAAEYEYPFEIVKGNFESATRLSLEAPINWGAGPARALRTVIADELIENSGHGLRHLGLDQEEIEEYLHIISQRVKAGKTGAEFQKSFIRQYGKEFGALSRAYQAQCATQKGVHEWEF